MITHRLNAVRNGYLINAVRRDHGPWTIARTPVIDVEGTGLVVNRNLNTYTGRELWAVTHARTGQRLAGFVWRTPDQAAAYARAAARLTDWRQTGRAVRIGMRGRVCLLGAIAEETGGCWLLAHIDGHVSRSVYDDTCADCEGTISR